MKGKALTSGQWMLLLLLAFAQLGTSADNGAFSVATSSIISMLNTTPAEIQLASTLYSVVAGAFMLVSALVGVRIGWSKTFRLGVFIACISEALTALTPSMFVLAWICRVGMGFAASLIIPSVLALVAKEFSGAQRKIAFGVIAGFAALATIVPIAFGIICDFFGFRVTFAVLSALFLVFCIWSVHLPKDDLQDTKSSFDVVGSTVLSSAFFVGLFGLSKMGVWGFFKALPGSPATPLGLSLSVWMLLASIILFVLVIPYELRREKRGDCVVLPSIFLKNAQIRAGLIAIALPFFYLGAQGIVGTFYYQLAIGLDAASTALLGLLAGVPMVSFAMFLPYKFPHTSPAKFLAVGYILLAIACGLMAFGMRLSYLSTYMLAATALGGAGVGFVNSSANNVVASAVSSKDAQQSGGIQGMARNIGIALGVAVVGSILLISVNRGLEGRIDADSRFPEAAKIHVHEVIYSYQSNAVIEQKANELPVDQDLKDDFIIYFKEARADAGMYAALVLSGLSIVSLLTLRHLDFSDPHFEPRDSSQKNSKDE